VMIRYPRGDARQVGELEVGEGLLARRMRAAAEPSSAVCVLAIGKMVGAADKAADALGAAGIDVTLWDVRSCAPLDPAMIADAAAHRAVVTIEDGIRDGGIGMTIADRVHGIDAARPVEVLGIPSRFIPQGKPEQILAQLGLDAEGIVATVRALAG